LRWWRRRAVLFRRGENGQVLDIAATEDDALVDGVGAGNLERSIAFAAFGAVTLHILQRDGRCFAVDGFERAHVSTIIMTG
jgi:uncharacterized protein YjlB